MFDNNIGSVVIIDNYERNIPVGIITERDILRILSTFQIINLQVPIRELMSYHLITLSSKASILDAMRLMYERKIRMVIIVEKDKMVGIVTEHDIFKLLMKNKELIATVIDSSFPIPQKHTFDEFSHFCFSQSFFK